MGSMVRQADPMPVPGVDPTACRTMEGHVPCPRRFPVRRPLLVVLAAVLLADRHRGGAGRPGGGSHAQAGGERVAAVLDDVTRAARTASTRPSRTRTSSRTSRRSGTRRRPSRAAGCRSGSTRTSATARPTRPGRWASSRAPASRSCPAIADGSGKGRMAEHPRRSRRCARSTSPTSSRLVVVERVRRHRPRLRGVRLQRRIVVVGGDAARTGRPSSPSSVQRCKAQGKLLAVTIPPPCNTAGTCGPEVGLLGLQHRRDRAGGGPRSGSWRTTTTSTASARSRRCRGCGRSSSTASRSWIRRSCRSACRRTAVRGRGSTGSKPPPHRHLPDRQGLGRVPLADREWRR